jgi:hypothetical protein
MGDVEVLWNTFAARTKLGELITLPVIALVFNVCSSVDGLPIHPILLHASLPGAANDDIEHGSEEPLCR